jgi:uncharacterized repeat protein (TIGR03803 family)
LVKRAITFVLLCLALPSEPAVGQVAILHSFAGGNGDGQNPFGSLTLSGSTLFGMTHDGGSAANAGTIFGIGTDGTSYGLRHSFTGGTDGGNPYGSLIQSGSTLFGLTLSGGASGYGTVFKVGADGSAFTPLHLFGPGPFDGNRPLGTPVLAGATLYGMTSQGGAANHGTVFRIDTSGTGYAVLHSFAGGPGDGQAPGYSALVVSGLTLYGMTIGGGTAGLGTVFKINTDGTGFALLHSFDVASGDGNGPYGSLILSGSTLYGTTRFGGAAGGGTVFKINTDGSGYGTLYSFGGSQGDGSEPLGSLLLSGSNL